MVLADVAGLGAITHMWFTIASNESYYLKKLVLRAYWDGEVITICLFQSIHSACIGSGSLKKLPLRLIFTLTAGKSRQQPTTQFTTQPGRKWADSGDH